MAFLLSEGCMASPPGPGGRALMGAAIGLLTLTGAGGSGKTRLALALAARQQGYFPDGVAWVPLAPLATSDQVIPAIGRALGVRDVPGEALGDILARVLG